jgi:hypothetical protein
MPLNLRDESSQSFLIKMLKTILEKKEPITLWQTSKSGRVVMTGFLFDLNLKTKKIIFKSYGNGFPFSTDHKIFFHCSTNNILFNTDIDLCDSKTLSIKFPLKMKAKENRVERRFDLTERVRPVDFNFMKSKAYESIPLEYSFKAADISNGGGSFLISSGALTNFLVDDTLMIKSVGKNDFSPPIKAKTRYITKISDEMTSGFSSYRIGFMFEEKIDTAKYLKNLF